MPLDVLRDEYKTLQDKIDRIGHFRFLVKGWSFTLMVGLVVAVDPGSFAWGYVVAGLLVILLFCWMEWTQVRKSLVLGRRAFVVEQAIQRELRLASDGGRRPVKTPRIAHELRSSPSGDSPVTFYVCQAAIVVVVFIVLWLSPPDDDAASGAAAASRATPGSGAAAASGESDEEASPP